MYCSLKAYCTALSPLFLDVPTSAARCLHARNDARDPNSERWNCVGENYLVILPKWRLPRHLGIFYMPQIYDMGPTALLPLRRKACWEFFRPGLNPRTWVLKGRRLKRVQVRENSEGCREVMLQNGCQLFIKCLLLIQIYTVNEMKTHRIYEMLMNRRLDCHYST